MVVDTAQGTFLYLSTLLGGPIVDASTGRNLGSLIEVACRTDTRYPQATRLFVRHGLFGEIRAAPWAAVQEIGLKGMRIDAALLVPVVGRPEPEAGEILLECDVLDQQVVDTDGAKVVRVNDVHLFLHGTDAFLAHVDIGARGLLRRLGYEKVVAGGIRLLTDYRLPERLVAWKHLHMLPSSVEDPHRATSVRLDVTQGRLNDLHPADMAELLADLDARTRDQVFSSLPTEAAAGALEEAAPSLAKEMLGSVEESRAADILQAMDPGEAADVVRDMARPEAEVLLDAMEPEAADTVRALLSHPDQSAGGLMTTGYMAADPAWTALRALEEVRRHSGEMEVFSYLYVLSSDGRLLGIVSLKQLFQAPQRTRIRDMLVTKVVSVPPEARRDEIERLLAKYGFRGVPVVDAEGRMQGVVRFRKVLEGGERRS